MDIHTAVLGLSIVAGAISAVETIYKVVVGKAPNANAVVGRIAVIVLCTIAVSYILLTPAKSSSAIVSLPAVMTAEAHYQKAKQYYDDHDRPQAIKEARQAVILEPTYKEAHKLLGTCYGMDQNMSAAASEYKEAARIDPDDTEAALALALCLEALGNRQEAKESYQYVIRHPESTPSQRQTAHDRLQTLGG